METRICVSTIRQRHYIVFCCRYSTLASRNIRISAVSSIRKSRTPASPRRASEMNNRESVQAHEMRCVACASSNVVLTTDESGVMAAECMVAGPSVRGRSSWIPCVGVPIKDGAQAMEPNHSIAGSNRSAVARWEDEGGAVAQSRSLG